MSLPPKIEDRLDVCIITPFRLQSMILRRAGGQSYGKRSRGEGKTLEVFDTHNNVPEDSLKELDYRIGV